MKKILKTILKKLHNINPLCNWELKEEFIRPIAHGFQFVKRYNCYLCGINLEVRT